ncbi:hypothetical protein MHB68_31110, partial [Bacillus sp. FSL K6-0040]|uniref:hypothetical protein n=1 Tax=Bacillus sp. FSL K6-0040 TaxID=2921406 RepID=UPI0030F9C5DD
SLLGFVGIGRLEITRNHSYKLFISKKIYLFEKLLLESEEKILIIRKVGFYGAMQLSKRRIFKL